MTFATAEGSYTQMVPANNDDCPTGQSLRDELLHSMSGGECLPLGHIDSIIRYDYPNETPSARQSRVLTVIESLLTEGLAVIGDIVGGTGAHVDPWALSTEQALTRLREIYVGRDDDEARWGLAVWFALTPEGERAATN